MIRYNYNLNSCKFVLCIYKLIFLASVYFYFNDHQFKFA